MPLARGAGRGLPAIPFRDGDHDRMTFTRATRTCLRKYFTFSGRAPRAEYWRFMLFVLLLSFVTSLADNLFFGAGRQPSEGVGDHAGIGATNGGMLGPIAGLAIVVPMLSAGWRRMHDTGRSGLFVLYPYIVLAGLTMFTSAYESLSAFMAADDMQTLNTVAALIALLAMAVFVISPFLVIWWLIRPSQPGTNKYGPNPYEVSQ